MAPHATFEHRNRLLASMFHGAPKIPTPWPRGGGLKGVPAIDPTAIEGVLASPAVLTAIDPAALTASQPWIVAEHVAYYLDDLWWRTGRTSADRWVAMNRFPMVLPDHRGRLTIVAGHHRAAAAMLLGEPLLARVGPGAHHVPVALTPSLTFAAGDDPQEAAMELRRRGLDDVEVTWAFEVARPPTSV